MSIVVTVLVKLMQFEINMYLKIFKIRLFNGGVDTNIVITYTEPCVEVRWRNHGCKENSRESIGFNLVRCLFTPHHIVHSDLKQISKEGLNQLYEIQ